MRESDTMRRHLLHALSGIAILALGAPAPVDLAPVAATTTEPATRVEEAPATVLVEPPSVVTDPVPVPVPVPEPVAPIPWGMDLAAIPTLRAHGAEPTFAVAWAGAWNDGGWSGIATSLRAMRAQGVTPVIHWYYWGDDISPACVTDGCVSSLHGGRLKTQATWWRMTAELRDLLAREMDGARVLVVVETEFNKGGVEGAAFAPVFDALLARQHAVLSEVDGVEIVLGLGSWGEPYWTRFPLAAASSDHVGLQALRSSVRSTEKAYLDVGASLVAAADRANARFPGTPLFVTDFGLSSWPETDYAERQARALEGLFARADDLRERGVAGILFRSLKDTNMDPANYHGEAERWWGLLHGDGSPKPAFDVFLAAVSNPPAPSPPAHVVDTRARSAGYSPAA